jgi:parallel beta-helix repeat protein
LDCNGFYIKGTNLANTIGIYASGRKNITIRNCGVQFYPAALYFLNVNQSNISYNLMSNYTAGNGHMMQLLDSYNNYVTYNNISYSLYAGIYISDNGGGVSAGNSTIANNRIEYCGTVDWGGIALRRSDWNNVTGNNVSYTSKYGLYLDIADRNNITNNNFISTATGIHIRDDCQNNVLTNNNASYNTVWDFLNAQSGSVSLGNVITNLSTGNVTSSFTYSPSVGDGVGLKSATAPAGGDPSGYRSIGRYINISGVYGTPWIYINITYQHSDLTGVGESTLRIWKNASSNWNQKLNLTGTLVSGVDTTNHYVYANISNFSSTYSPMELLEVTGCSNITVAGTYNLTADLTGNLSHGVCIDIQKPGVTLDCKGKNITGAYSGSTAAVYSNTSIVKNCIIKNYTNGIYGGGNFTNNTIYNISSRGIYCSTVSAGYGNCNATLNTIVNATVGAYLGVNSILFYNNISAGNTGIDMDNIQGTNENISHNRIFGNVWGINASGTNHWVWNNNFTNTYNANDNSAGTNWNITKNAVTNIIG